MKNIDDDNPSMKRAQSLWDQFVKPNEKYEEGKRKKDSYKDKSVPDASNQGGSVQGTSTIRQALPLVTSSTSRPVTSETVYSYGADDTQTTVGETKTGPIETIQVADLDDTF
ncbi:unnamed protein product [Ambrosiozyma monospora]|uniref:Unnamed protein product n=1 Tax=Ambrosiozyma monospora TaxID=43982 RepID=A0ACB5T2K4_AMBMO|nr:unnamed protein product [Ambrosiozyma monospora]